MQSLLACESSLQTADPALLPRPRRGISREERRRPDVLPAGPVAVENQVARPPRKFNGRQEKTGTVAAETVLRVSSAVLIRGGHVQVATVRFPKRMFVHSRRPSKSARHRPFAKPAGESNAWPFETCGAATTSIPIAL